MEVSLDAIKALREQTGAGIMDCKRALQDAGGDMEKASEILKQKGLATVAKKASRATGEGVVDAYLHSGNRIGALVELNCETDFVARTAEFRELAHNVAMQVAAMAPKYSTPEEVPPEDRDNADESVLLLQPYIKDPSRTVQDVINDVIARVGENIRVRRFARFALGEE